ncbi:MAG TPA: hypothetical protein PKA64_07995, partial [Myxococcota bacterium]|nr:hypothetical protein [Myxococcota bacterium]
MRAILALTLLAACTPETTDAPDDTSDTSDTDDTPAGPDITVAAEDLATLRDAAPNADGSRIWYVADRAPGDAALFEAGTSTAIAGGFVRLDNLVLSSDATRAWVTGEGDAGPVLASITLATGAVEEVEAAAAYEPLGLDLTVEAGADTLWFSGFDRDSGEVGVFRLDPSTGAITPFATA